MKIWRVQVQFYWVCLVVELHLLHHLITDEPADAVHEVPGSIHWGKLAHKSSVLSLRSYHNLGVSLQNGIVVACMEKLVDIKSKLQMIKLVLLNSFIHSSSTVLTCISKANKCGDSIFIFEGEKKNPNPLEANQSPPPPFPSHQTGEALLSYPFYMTTPGKHILASGWNMQALHLHALTWIKHISPSLPSIPQIGTGTISPTDTAACI